MPRSNNNWIGLVWSGRTAHHHVKGYRTAELFEGTRSDVHSAQWLAYSWTGVARLRLIEGCPNHHNIVCNLKLRSCLSVRTQPPTATGALHRPLWYGMVSTIQYGMVWWMSAKDCWRPKRPGPATDRDSVTRQTLRAGIRAPPPEKPYLRIGARENVATVSVPTLLGESSDHLPPRRRSTRCSVDSFWML